MIYSVSLKGGEGINCNKLKLKEYWEQPGKKIKYGVAYLQLGDINYGCIWTRHHHVNGIKECNVSVDNIDKISTRSNDYETNEPWKIVVRGTKGKFSYKKTDKVTQQIKKLL